MATSREILVVANRTIGGARLAAHLAEVIASDPAVSFYVLVPAEPSLAPLGASIPEMGTFPVDFVALDDELRKTAEARLATLLAWLRDAGALADGEVGASSALVAIDEVLRRRSCAEIVVSSLPIGKSRWLRSDLTQRARRRFGLPATLVISDGDEAMPTAPNPPARRVDVPEVATVIALVGVDPRVTAALAVAPAVRTQEVEGGPGSVGADVVLVDFDVLGDRGWNVLDDILRAVDSERAVVAVLTSQPNRVDWQRAHAAGVSAYLSKPSADAELGWLLDTVLHDFRTLGTVGDLAR